MGKRTLVIFTLIEKVEREQIEAYQIHHISFIWQLMLLRVVLMQPQAPNWY
jgi:Trm5-related predicted tRNA methylase